VLQMCTYPEERAARSSTTIVCKPTIHADTEFPHKPTTILCLMRKVVTTPLAGLNWCVDIGQKLYTFT